ncbi:MAG: tetratricopeptide repeat protein [Candidatus Rifleibacteriota bacterium]
MLSKKSVKMLFLTASICLAGLSLSNVTVKAREESIEDRLFKKLEAAVQQGRLKDSKEDIKRVLKLNPRHAGATFYAGSFAFEKKDFTNAQKFLSRVENDVKYGVEARKLLNEIRQSQFQRKYLDNLQIAITGEAYSQALSICDEILAEMPENQDVLFLGAYAATMNNDQDRAEKLVQQYQKTTASGESKAELKAFIDAMFSAGYSPETAVEKLISLSDRRLLTLPVRNKLKSLIVSLRELDLFEKFINQEKGRSGSDTDKLERELIEFLIEQKQYEKAMNLINSRPGNQIEDNVLYVRLLVLTGKEEKAMLSARQLISAYPEDLRLYEAWTDAWLGFVERTSKTPEGKDETGKSFDEMAQEVLERLKYDKLVKMQPNLLLKLIRLAVLTENEEKVKEARSEAVKIPFNSQNVDLLLKTVDSLISINRSSIASELLESARNQVHDDHRLSVKLAEIYYINNNPEASAKILEAVLNEKPEQIKAFLLWTDCMTTMGKGPEAEIAILKRLEEKDVADLVKRQLNNKLEVIRMQTSVGSSYSTENEDTDTSDSSGGYQSQTGEMPSEEDDESPDESGSGSSNEEEIDNPETVDESTVTEEPNTDGGEIGEDTSDQ